MMFPVNKKQISTIAVALIFSFYSVAATAAPVAPMVRTPGTSAGTVPRQNSSQSTTITPQSAAEPVQASQPATESAPVTKAPVETMQPVTVSPVTTDIVPAASKPVTTSRLKEAETVKPAVEKKQSPEVVPGHPFRIQNKTENYNSLLSKTATRKLDAALADMIFDHVILYFS